MVYAKQEAKTILYKYDIQLSQFDSNDIILIIRKMREIYKKGIIRKEDIKESKRIMAFLKESLLMVPILMIFAIALVIFL